MNKLRMFEVLLLGRVIKTVGRTKEGGRLHRVRVKGIDGLQC